MKNIIRKQIKLYVDGTANPIWKFLESRFELGESRYLEKKPLDTYLSYRDDYRKRVLQSDPFAVYPYLPASKIRLNKPKYSAPQKSLQKGGKILYLAGWQTLEKVSISAQDNLIIQLQELPQYEPNNKIYKISFEQATYIFVSTFELKDYIMTNFDLNPYKIIVLKTNLDHELPNPERVSNQKYVFVLGDLFKGQVSLDQLREVFAPKSNLVFIGHLDRLKKVRAIIQEGFFLDHLEAEIWHKFHSQGEVYSLNLETSEFRPCLFEDFQTLNLNYMYEKLNYHLSQIFLD